VTKVEKSIRRIGIVGGGQLGRMLALAARNFAFEVRVVDPNPDCPASGVVDEVIVGAFDDARAIEQLADKSDVITFEIESAGVEVLEKLQARGIVVSPSPRSLAIIRDKLGQKQFLVEKGISVAPFAEVISAADVEKLAQQWGYPLLLKSRFGAYDGRGNAVIDNVEEIPLALDKLGNKNLYAEAFVPFIKEMAVMAARDVRGEIVLYPVVETEHYNNILRTVQIPAPIVPEYREAAEGLARQVMTHLDGAGVFGIELFLTSKGEVLVNEIAPRVHNSGHYTIEACLTSQFENQIRAVCGLPLGQTLLRTPAAVMVNLLGEENRPAELSGLSEVLAIDGAAVHIYGKKDSRPERKMGHITVLDISPTVAHQKAMAAIKALKI